MEAEREEEESNEPVSKKLKLSPAIHQHDISTSEEESSTSEEESSTDDDDDIQKQRIADELPPDNEADKLKLAQIKKNIDDLTAKGFVGIGLSVSRLSEAFDYLAVNCDPRGFMMKNATPIDCWTRESCDNYLIMLKRLGNCKEVKTSNNWSINWDIACDLGSDLGIYGELCSQVLKDYYLIYFHKHALEQWSELHEFLFVRTDEARNEHSHSCETFRGFLKMKFPRLGPGVDFLLMEVFKWWESGLEEDKLRAQEQCQIMINEYQSLLGNRLKDVGYTNGDYLKLKMDVAIKVGIIDDLPDELVDFDLPGHYDWLKEGAVLGEEAPPWCKWGKGSVLVSLNK